MSIVLRCGGELLITNYLVRYGACLELLCELCATDGYIQGDSSGVVACDGRRSGCEGRSIYSIYVVKEGRYGRTVFMLYGKH